MKKIRKIHLVKQKKFEERRDRSLCVRIKNKSKMERKELDDIIKGIHKEIETVFFPRQKFPK